MPLVAMLWDGWMYTYMPSRVRSVNSHWFSLPPKPECHHPTNTFAVSYTCIWPVPYVYVRMWNVWLMQVCCCGCELVWIKAENVHFLTLLTPTQFNRRHHCRRCGEVVCSKCSSYSLPIEGHSIQQRACWRCYQYESRNHSAGTGDVDFEGTATPLHYLWHNTRVTYVSSCSNICLALR